MIKWLKQILCKHDWLPMFDVQNDPREWHECYKCEKQKV